MKEGMYEKVEGKKSEIKIKKQPQKRKWERLFMNGERESKRKRERQRSGTVFYFRPTP